LSTVLLSGPVSASPSVIDRRLRFRIVLFVGGGGAFGQGNAVGPAAICADGNVKLFLPAGPMGDDERQPLPRGEDAGEATRSDELTVEANLRVPRLSDQANRDEHGCLRRCNRNRANPVYLLKLLPGIRRDGATLLLDGYTNAFGGAHRGLLRSPGYRLAVNCFPPDSPAS
jgi:hypothetical protein